MTRDDMRQQLDETLAELADDELFTVTYLAMRLLEGQKQYGRLSLATDPRDWRKERAQEVADLLIYSAFELLRTEVVPP